MILSSEVMGKMQVNNPWEEPYILVKICNIPKKKVLLKIDIQLKLKLEIVKLHSNYFFDNIVILEYANVSHFS